jgi:hypothetical protein
MGDTLRYRHHTEPSICISRHCRNTKDAKDSQEFAVASKAAIASKYRNIEPNVSLVRNICYNLVVSNIFIKAMSL